MQLCWFGDWNSCLPLPVPLLSAGAVAAEGDMAEQAEEEEEAALESEEEDAAEDKHLPQQENAGDGNTAAAPSHQSRPAVPVLDTSALPAPKGGSKQRVLSPSALGKRSRAVESEAPLSGRSPSKLRGAFTRNQQRSARGERKD